LLANIENQDHKAVYRDDVKGEVYTMSDKPEDFAEDVVNEEDVADEANEDGDGESAFKSFVHHQRRAMEELGRAIEALFPDDFKEHTKNAGKSFVDSFRSLVDAAKDDMKKRRRTEDGEPEAQAATKIKVEIE
jgi:hypothetical protein